MSRVVAAIPMMLIAVDACAQFSAFASASYGYQSNPLYNYQNLSDQVMQGYLQATYAGEIGRSFLSASYINGSALFNRFADRNYVEHSVNAGCQVRIGPELAGAPERDATEGDVSREDSSSSVTDGSSGADDAARDTLALQSIQQIADSSDVFLGFSVKISNRIDKEVHREFDNMGAEQLSWLRLMAGDDVVFRINNTIGYRSYTYLRELSNVSNILALQVRNAPASAWGFGVNLGGGVKHYVNGVTDTSKFESVRSYIIKPSGHGKPGGKFQSTKLLLANPNTATSYQLMAGLFLEKKWAKTSVAYDLAVRVNSKTPPRYLAQSTSASGLNQDIYNDQFSSAGWGTKVTTHSLVASIQVSTTLELQNNRFAVSAYDLAGDKIGGNRRDLRTSAELGFTKSFSLSESVDMELILVGSVLRNQSNDEYSDFSALGVSFGLGVGF